jgi:hypothetical protein
MDGCNVPHKLLGKSIHFVGQQQQHKLHYVGFLYAGVLEEALIIKHTEDEPKWAGGLVDEANQSRNGPAHPWEVKLADLLINVIKGAIAQRGSKQLTILEGCKVVDGSASLSSQEVVHLELLYGHVVVFARTFIVASGRYGPSASVIGKEGSGQGVDGTSGGTAGRGHGAETSVGSAGMGVVPEGVCLRVQPGPGAPLSTEEMQWVAACLTAAKEASSADCLVFEKSHLEALGAASLVLVFPRPLSFKIQDGTRVVAHVTRSLALSDTMHQAQALGHAEVYPMGKVTHRGSHDGADKKTVVGFEMASFGFRQCSGSTGPNAVFGPFITDDPQADPLVAKLATREYAALYNAFTPQVNRLENIVLAKGTAPHAPCAVITGTFVTLKTVTLNYSSRLHTDRKDHEEGGSFVVWWDFLEEDTLFMPGLFWLTTGLAFTPGSGSAMWMSSHELLHQSEPCMCWQRDSDGAWRWARRVGGLQQGRYGTALTVNPTTLTSWVGRCTEVHDRVNEALKDAGLYSLEKADAVITEFCEDVKSKAAKRKSGKKKSTRVATGKGNQGSKERPTGVSKKKGKQLTTSESIGGDKRKKKSTEGTKRKAAEETEGLKRRRA